MNIYIGNFSREVTEEDLQQAFGAFGQVASVTIIKDRMSGESRGFGFVEMPSKKEAGEAMNGIRELKGRMVTVNEARPRSSDRRGGGRRDSKNRRYGQRRDRGYY